MLNLIGIGLSFIGSLFLIKGFIMSDKDIEELSISGKGFGSPEPKEAIKFLKQQKRDSIIGAVLLSCGFILQFIAIYKHYV